jgi:uncharacterized membrane protein
MNTKLSAVIVGLFGALATFGFARHEVAHAAAVEPVEFATITVLPSLQHGAGAEALAIDEAGTVIVGHAWDRSGLLHAVKWTLQSGGAWAISDLAWPAGASSTIARGVNNNGDVAGNDFPATTSRALLWLGGVSLPRILGCATDVGPATVYAISANAQVVIGEPIDWSVPKSTGAVWRHDGNCREDLPLLVAGGSAAALAVNGDGTIVGGTANGFPVRWTNVAGQWRIEPLGTLRGVVHGANGAGDLTGSVETPCGSAAVCHRAAIWYTSGDSRELGTLGGAESWARDINSNGEVVGVASLGGGVNTGFFWSPDPAVGMLQLPFNRRWAGGNALSDVRPDGTRLVAGMDSQGRAVVWVVRNP